MLGGLPTCPGDSRSIFFNCRRWKTRYARVIKVQSVETEDRARDTLFSRIKHTWKSGRARTPGNREREVGTRDRREEGERDRPRGQDASPGLRRDGNAILTYLAGLWGRPGSRLLPGRCGCCDFQGRGAYLLLPLFAVASPPSQVAYPGGGCCPRRITRGWAAWSGRLTFFLPSLPSRLSPGRLRHVRGQPQRRVSHARAAALAAPARGHQQRRGRRAPAGAARVAPGPAAGGVPVHQHCAGPGLRHLRGAEDPAGHLDRALPGRPPAPGEGAGRRCEEHAASLGGKSLAAQHLANQPELWPAKSLALGGGRGGGSHFWGEPPLFSRR